MATDEVKPVFFPAPPERPRLQFLKSFSGPADLGARGPSGFEKFVLGDAEQQEGISTPYGLALFDSKIYVCDVGKRRVEVLDLKTRAFGYLTDERRLMNPANIFIEEDGTKYVTDPKAGAVFVFDADDTLQAILGEGLKINPRDVVVRGAYCYVTDLASNQVVVLDKTTGREVGRIGQAGDAEGQFKLIRDLAFGPDGDLYVTDFLKSQVFQFDPSGNLKRTVGQRGDSTSELLGPKGIAVDPLKRIWLVDAGVARTGFSSSMWSTEVAKIYDPEGKLLLFFGGPAGNEPGRTNMPAKVILDYDHVDLFKRYAVKGAKIDFLVLISNQYGPNKISVYGFGDFPAGRRSAGETSSTPGADDMQRPSQTVVAGPATAPEAARPEAEAASTAQMEQIAQVYYRSMTLYRAGRLQEARAGFAQVLESGLVPPPMQATLQGLIQDIDGRTTSGQRPRP